MPSRREAVEPLSEGHARGPALEEVPWLFGPTVRTRDPAAIAKLLAARGQGHPWQVFAGGQARPFSLRLVQVPRPGEGDLWAAILGPSGPLDDGRVHTLVLPTGLSLFLFHAALARADRDHVRIAFPTVLFQGGFRSSRRAVLSEDVGRHLTFVHPRRPPAGGAGLVHDVGAGGLSFDPERGSDELLPGDRLEDLVVSVAGQTIAGAATVKGLSSAAGRVRCGLQWDEFRSVDDRQAWHRFVFDRCHGRLRRTSLALDDVWEVFETSTYVDAWLPRERAGEIRAKFRQVWEGIGSDQAALLVLKEGAPIGTIAASQIYPQTWLMHGLAIDKRQRAHADRRRFLDFARELYAGVNYALAHLSGCRYFLAYFEETKSWNQRLYRDFVQERMDGADQLYDRFLVFRNGSAATRPAPSSQKGQVVEADQPLLRRVSQRAQQIFSPLLVDAMALSADAIGLGPLAAAFQAGGLERARSIFVAYDGGAPVMAAVCESGSEGLNIFGLMNLCWTIPMVDGEPGEETYRALIDAVVAHYYRLGLPDFLFLEGRPDRAAWATRAGLALVSSGVRWLARVEVLPAWLGYVENELAAVAHGSGAGDARAPVAAQAVVR
jgi:hypothetical protein